MATIQNARDVLLQAAATRLETVAGPTNVTTDFANVTGSTRPSNNADVTQAAVNSGVTASSGGITLSSGGAIKGGQTAYDSGNGFFLGYTGSAYKFSVGNSSGNKFTWDGSTLAVVGDISGSSGTFSGTITAANISAGNWNNAITYGGTFRVDNCSVSDGSFGDLSTSTFAANTINASSTFTWNGYTYAAPAGSSTTCMHNDGVWRDPVTTARVNAAFGCSESDVLQLIVTDSGTATVGGSGINLTSTIAGVRFRATGSNNIVLETF